MPQGEPVTQVDWEQKYTTGHTPWDSGEPSEELRRIIQEGWIHPRRMLELGCGTGTNAVFLAARGFDVTAVELASIAVERANEKARKSDIAVRFLEADVLRLPDLGPAFPFVFDRGVYHVLRDVDLDGFRHALARVVMPGDLYLTLAANANANDTSGEEGGPRRVRADEICSELGPLFELVQLREFPFNGVFVQGREVSQLGWSVLLRRKTS